MAQIVTLPPAPMEDRITPLLQDYMTDTRSRRLEAIQQGQLDLSREKQGDERDMAAAKQFVEYTVAALKNDPGRLAEQTRAFLAQNPGAGKYLQAYAQGRDATQGELAAQGADTFKNRAVQAVNSGSNDVQNLDITREIAGTKFNPQSFLDAQMRQKQAVSPGGGTASIAAPGGTPEPNAISSGRSYTDFLRRQSQELPTGADYLKADAQKDIARMEIKANEGVRAAQVQQLLASAETERQQARKVGNEADLFVPGSDYGKKITASVISDPRSWKNLDAQSQKLVRQTLGRAPAPLTGDDEKAFEAALQGKQQIANMTALQKKWEARGLSLVGPALGRYNEASQQWGAMVVPPVPKKYLTEYMNDIGTFQDNLVNLKAQESKIASGGRQSVAVLNLITKATPRFNMDPRFWWGTVNGLNQRFDQTEKHMRMKPWGGKPPDVSMLGIDPQAMAGGGGQAPTGAAPAAMNPDDPFGILPRK